MGQTSSIDIDEAQSARGPWTLVAAMFAMLPALAALTFRTYTWGVSPGWFEVVRQLDLLYGAVEIGVIWLARRRGFSYAATFLRLPHDARLALILFLATFWISSVFVTGFFAYSVVRAALWPLHLLFGAALCHLGGRSDATAVRRLVLALLLGYGAYAPALAVHFLTAPDASAIPGGKIIWTSALPGYLSVRHFGIEMGALLAMVIGTLWRDPRALGRPSVGFTAVMLVGGAACWSGTRAALFGVVGATLITMVARRNLPRASAAGLILVALLLGGAAGQLMLPPHESFGFRLAPPATAAGGYSSGRLDLWLAALRLFGQRPLTGWGEGSALWLITWDGVSFAHPHNMPIQMLESWGAPAACAAFYLIGRLWLASQRSGRARDWMLPVLMATDALLIMSLVDGVFYHARLMMLVAVLNAIGLSARAPEADDAARGTRQKGRAQPLVRASAFTPVT